MHSDLVYRTFALKDEALAVLRKLTKLTNYSNLDYLHDLALMDSTMRDAENDLYANKLLAKERFYSMYEDLYNYLNKEKYAQVINQADSILRSVTLDKYEESQVAYLHAMAIGYSSPIDSLILAFEKIVKNYSTYPITKVVSKHLEFIGHNKLDFDKRTFALERSKERKNGILVAHEETAELP